jgi:hypothetical protein
MIFDCSCRSAKLMRVWQLRARQNRLRSIKPDAITGLEAAQMKRDPETGRNAAEVCGLSGWRALEGHRAWDSD